MKSSDTPSVAWLDHRDADVARRIVEIQHSAYLVESALIRYEIPAIHATPHEIMTSDEVFLGCGVDGSLAGVTSYDEGHGDVEICRLVVDPSQFRRGIGAALVRTVVSRLGATRGIYVSTGEDNHPAIRLYEKQQFRITERRTLGDGLRLVSLRREPS